MGRSRDPKRDQAFEIYKASGGKINLNVIAAQLGVESGTIRVWKNRDKWDAPEGVTPSVTLQKNKQNNKRNVTEKVKRLPKREKKAKTVKATISDEIEKDELTDKQRLFCIYYVKYWNAGKAAKKAGYDYSYPNGFYEIGSQLHKKTQVKNEIERLKENIVNGIGLEVMAVFQKYIDIAFTDITDYLTFGQREVPVMTMFGPMMEGEGDDKKPVTKIVNYVDFKPSDEIDGTLISEIKQGKEGVSIKLADKMKALEKLERYFDLFPDNFKRKIEEEKLNLAKERLELDKAKAAGEGDLDEELIDDWVGAVMDDGDDTGDEEGDQ